MNFKPGLFSIVLAPFGALFAHTVNAAQNAPVPFSKYGQIQAVQNYSSNPFWSKDSPYNQKMPTPVYAMGPDLNTGDCQRIVDSLVASQCAANNNCVGMKIADIRPNIIVGLSQLPGHSFATSCAGYIDSSFNNYVKKYGYVKPSVGAAFPTAYAPNPNASGTANTDTTVNLFQPKPTSYQSGVLERTRELAELHASTSNGSPVLATTAFPTTIADLSMSQRMELKSDGYEPYKDSVIYHPITIQSEEDYQKELKAQNMSVYCARYPNGEGCDKYNNDFTKAKTDAQQQITEVEALLAKYGSKITSAEKTTIDTALAQLKNTVNAATVAATSTTTKLNEQTEVLKNARKPLDKKRQDAEEAAQRAANERDAAVQKAKDLIDKYRALYNCFKSDLSSSASGLENAIDELEKAVRDSSKKATDIEDKITKADAAANPFITHYESNRSDCPAYTNLIGGNGGGGNNNGDNGGNNGGNGGNDGGNGGNNGGSGNGDGSEGNPEAMVA